MGIILMNEKYEYDIALSFAGEDRPYVEEVAYCLKQYGLHIFYDIYEQVNLWGKDLYIHLCDVYQNRAKYCIVFISKHYKDKLWTDHEMKSAFARAFKSNCEYILPVRFDDTEIIGINPTIGYIDLRVTSPCELAEKAKCKIMNKHNEVTADCNIAREENLISNRYFELLKDYLKSIDKSLGAFEFTGDLTMTFGCLREIFRLSLDKYKHLLSEHEKNSYLFSEHENQLIAEQYNMVDELVDQFVTKHRNSQAEDTPVVATDMDQICLKIDEVTNSYLELIKHKIRSILLNE